MNEMQLLVYKKKVGRRGKLRLLMSSTLPTFLINTFRKIIDKAARMPFFCVLRQLNTFKHTPPYPIRHT